MFVPSAKRDAYFPRTPPPKSYSSRIGFSGSLLLLIDLAFGPRGQSGADDGNIVIRLAVRHDHETVLES